MDDQLEISEINKEKNKIIVNKKYKFNFMVYNESYKSIQMY